MELGGGERRAMRRCRRTFSIYLASLQACLILHIIRCHSTKWRALSKGSYTRTQETHHISLHSQARLPTLPDTSFSVHKHR